LCFLEVVVFHGPDGNGNPDADERTAVCGKRATLEAPFAAFNSVTFQQGRLEL